MRAFCRHVFISWPDAQAELTPYPAVPLSLVHQLLTNRQFTCPKCKKVQLVAIQQAAIDAILRAVCRGATVHFLL